jgi:fructuronate reductase
VNHIVHADPRPEAVALNRTTLAERGGRAEPAPVRIVHLGLGAFARAHQAWYTSVVDKAGEWGIAAFTGRSADAASALAPQDGLFHVVERSASGDVAHLVTSIVEAADGEDTARLLKLLAAPETAIVTLTITELGYRLRSDGAPDTGHPAVIDDIEILRQLLGGADRAHNPRPQTALGRLVLGLDARRRAGVGPLAVVPCDNIADNGTLVRTGLMGLAAAVDRSLADWIGRNVSFVSTSVDRITPRTTPADVEATAKLTGWRDAAPVVTEPFHDWILSGGFPAGRPAWERAGARFVDDIEPFEHRKLWLLNGAHSLLAYLGMLRGHTTVSEAIADCECRVHVIRLWDEARCHLPEELDLDAYTTALLTRFENPRIEHRLEQISAEAVAKLRVRAVPIARAERDAGRGAGAVASLIAAWIALVRAGRVLDDTHWAAAKAASAEADPIRAMVRLLDENLAADGDFVEAVRRAIAAWAAPSCGATEHTAEATERRDK